MSSIASFIKIFLQSLNLILSDKVFRGMIYRPLLSGLRIAIYFTLGWIVLSYFSCGIGADYLAKGNSFLFIAGNFLAFIILLPLTVFLYFSFFCDEPYQKIASYGLWLEGVANGAESGKTADLKLNLRDRSPFVSILQVVFFTFLLVFSLIASFFFPLFGLVFGGLILVWDFASYSFNELDVSYFKRVNFIFDNIILAIFLSVVFGAIVLIPFVILIFYPIGVFMSSRFVRISGKFV